jgi:ferredoxin-thioredoxin reductase catalytic subunit
MDISAQHIDAAFKKLVKDAEAGGYHLNPDQEFTKELVLGLLINENRYGYWACPCRLAAGIKKMDLDVVCPCDYRDADLGEYDACYCGLYVSSRVLNGEKKIHAIPERRPPEEMRAAGVDRNARSGFGDSLPLPVWRCKVCGYLCAREDPPEVCPICKAKKERFERFV